MKFKVPVALFRQYAAVITVNLCVITSGMSLSWPSPVLIKLYNADESPLSRPITDDEGSWIVSVGLLCAVISNSCGGTLLDKIGRRKCILLIYIPKISMIILFIFATEVWVLILGRAIILMADCFGLFASSVYIAEIASSEYRSILGTLLQVFMCIGELLSYAIGPFTSYRTYNIIFLSIVVLSFLPIFICLDESPSFLYAKGRKEESLKVLTHLRDSPNKAIKEIEEYNVYARSSEDKVSKWSLIKNKTFQKSFALSSLLAMGTQLSGQEVVTFYLQSIFSSTNTNIKPEISSVSIGIIRVISSLFAHSVMSSRFGRKTILTLSYTGMCLGMAGLGTFFKISESKDYVISDFMNYLPIGCLMLVFICATAGIGSMLWVMIGELFDDKGRAFGVSASLASAIFLAFLTSKFFPFIANNLGPAATYWTFSVLNILMIILIYLFIPETKGKNFNEIQNVLRQ